MKNWMKSSFIWTKKNVKVKPIESYNLRERYQADIILFPNFVWDRFKYNLQWWIISQNMDE